MISEPFENFHKEIWNLTRKLLNLKFLNTTFCEKSLSEFKDSLISDMKKLNDKLSLSRQMLHVLEYSTD